MRRTWAICRKELQMYFYSPTSYAAFAFFFLIVGYMFSSNFLYSMMIDVRMVTSPVSFLYLLVIPFLTMRLVSDELRHGTDELLLTSPASITEIILGKYLAAVVVQFLLVAGCLLYPLIMSSYGKLDQPVLWLSFLSMFLLGAAMMAVGLFASTLSSHQMLSGLAGIGMLLVLWTIDWLGDTVAAGRVKEYLSIFSIVTRGNNLQKGVLNFADILFYVTLAIVFIVLSIQVLERKRWR